MTKRAREANVFVFNVEDENGAPPVPFAGLDDDAVADIMGRVGNEALVYKGRNVSLEWRRVIDNESYAALIWEAHLLRISGTPGLAPVHGILINAELALPQPMTLTRFEDTVAGTMGTAVMRFFNHAVSWQHTFANVLDRDWPTGLFRVRVTLCPLDEAIDGAPDAAHLSITSEFRFSREFNAHGHRVRDASDTTQGDVVTLKQWRFTGGSNAVADILRQRDWRPDRNYWVPQFVRQFMREHGCFLRLRAEGFVHYDALDNDADHFERIPLRLDGTTHENTRIVTNVPL